jgi:hypothetical protein
VVDRAFDAQEILLKEGQIHPNNVWRTVSLVTAMRQMLLRGPFDFAEPAVRRQVFLQAATVLESRGIDPQSLTHYGLTQETMGSVVAAMIAPILGGNNRNVANLTLPNKNGIWNKFLEADQPEVPSETDLHSIVSYIRSITAAVLHRIHQWAYTAPWKTFSISCHPTVWTLNWRLGDLPTNS